MASHEQSLPPHEDGFSAESQERLPFQGRSFVIIGGTSGLGLTFAVEAKKLGADHILLGSSDLTGDNYAMALTRFRRLNKGDVEGVVPLLVDITDTGQVVDAVTRVKNNGIPVTDVIISAAGGMREFGIEFQTDVRQMSAILTSGTPDAQAQVKEHIAELNRKLDIWLPQYRESALSINFRAPRRVVEEFAYRYDNFNVSYINSMFGKSGESPKFYTNVALKVLFSRWLAEHAEQLATAGIGVAEFTAFVVEDTDVGRLFINYIAPLCPPEVREAIINTRVKKADVVAAMNGLLRMPQEERAQCKKPYHRYVVGDQGQAHVLEELPPHLVIDTKKFPF